MQRASLRALRERTELGELCTDSRLLVQAGRRDQSHRPQAAVSLGPSPAPPAQPGPRLALSGRGEQDQM